MGRQIQGFGGAAAGEGFYRLSVVSGTIAAALAASAVVFTARWTDTGKRALIYKLRTSFLPLTPFTAATLTDHTSLDAFVGRTYTASFTNQTALTLTGNSFKANAAMPSTAFADIRIANTGAITGGTVTVDPHPFAQSLRKGNRVNPAAATEETIQPSNDALNVDFVVSEADYPLALGVNEGIVIRNRTVWPAAGTGILLVEMAWSEVPNF